MTETIIRTAARRPAGAFLIKLVAVVVLAVLGDVLFWQNRQGGGFLGLFGLALITAAILCRPALRRDRRALACLGLAALAALAMVLDPGPVAWCLFWALGGMGVLMPATARFGDAWQWAQRLVLLGLRSGIAPMLDTGRLLRVQRMRGGFRLRGVLPQLALPVLGSVVIIALFANANPVIEQALALVTPLSWLSPDPLQLLLWAVLIVLAWSLLRPRLPRRLPHRLFGTFDGSGDLALPGVNVTSVLLSLITFNLLFAMQNVMDMAWLWGVLPLPPGLTLAEYAHRGAYPLMATALLAAGFVLVALRPGSRTAAQPLIRRLVVLWVAQNLLLVANAALRTLDYIAAYSLTGLRIAALLWMALVALGLVLTCWRMMRGKSAAWLINSNAGAAVALLLGCSFVDLPALAASYNAHHARELGGRGAPLDMCYLQHVGPSALLPLAELEHSQRADEATRLMARLLRENAQIYLASDLAEGNWSLRGAMRMAELQRRLPSATPAPQHRPFRDCDQRDAGKLRLLIEPAPLPPEAVLTPGAKP